jgi:hypothetical protein
VWGSITLTSRDIINKITGSILFYGTEAISSMQFTMLLELWKCGENEKNCTLTAIDLRPHSQQCVSQREERRYACCAFVFLQLRRDIKEHQQMPFFFFN